MSNVLVACEYSGIVTKAFRDRGHNAWSVDLLPTDGNPLWHIQRDVFEVLNVFTPDLIIAFPPCTDLSAIGASSWKEKQADGRQQAAAEFFKQFFSYAPRVAVENPVGWMNTNYRKPDQIFHPYHFGDPWQKRTCLWLKNLPVLGHTNVVEPAGYWVANQSRTKLGGQHRKDQVEASGQAWGSCNKHDRAKTFQGVADAMAEQWGKLI